MVLRPRNQWIPKKPAERGLFLAVLSLIIGVPLYELLVIIPIVDHHHIDIWHILHIALWALLAYLCLGHLFRFVTIDPSTRGYILPTALKEGWRFCHDCGANAPPRSGHCYYCKVCILRQEHHCFVYGTCLGFHNYKHYMFFLLFLWFGLVYCNIMHVDYLIEQLGSLNPISLLTLVVPFLIWVLRLTDSFSAFAAFVAGVSFWGLLVTSGLLVWHTKLIMRGVTRKENKRSRLDYALSSVSDNWRLVFGSRWLRLMLLPFAVSPQPGDGIEFRKRTDCNIKDM